MIDPKTRDQDDQDIQVVMKHEKARGTKHKPPDAEKLRERARIRSQMRDLLRERDRAAFLKMLLVDYGLQAGSKSYYHALKIWDDYQRSRKTS